MEICEWVRQVVGRSRAEPEPVTGKVHAVLVPAGLVEVGGVVEPAVWAGPGDPPGRGGRVSVTYDSEGGAWTAAPLDREDAR
ncbi:hypothetical protein [Paractinoplanes lichenicola]|uniref:Uncharacterized protein n=1 Tax=Paractinoplanes lichenicola TaxID=2802976 RepID=A0ABS1VDE6_9ACTN|nr:hypothetical protein [Actinoplanes lichenicola]MBL7252709.1 hypothetical protein [Actinoplanes lichenicola]